MGLTFRPALSHAQQHASNLQNSPCKTKQQLNKILHCFLQRSFYPHHVKLPVENHLDIRSYRLRADKENESLFSSCSLKLTNIIRRARETGGCRGRGQPEKHPGKCQRCPDALKLDVINHIIQDTQIHNPFHSCLPLLLSYSQPFQYFWELQTQVCLPFILPFFF